MCRDLIEVQERNLLPIPIDHYTDCNDLFELITGEKGVPQDKTQRLYVMGLREDRLTRRVRYLFKIPTDVVVSDALTKSMISYTLYTLLTSGFWKVQHVKAKHVIAALALERRQTYTD